jgi:hypothetical protein
MSGQVNANNPSSAITAGLRNGGGSLYSSIKDKMEKDNPTPWKAPDAGTTDPTSDPFGIGKLETSDPTKATQQFDYMSGQVAKQLAAGGYDPKTAGDYYKQADAPIQSDFFNQSQSTASYLARQGLGSSGINVASSQVLTNNKAALESQARLKSTDTARELKRRELLDAFSTSAMGLQPMLQNKGIDVGLRIAQMQLQAQEDALSQQAASGWGQLIGTGIGIAKFGG